MGARLSPLIPGETLEESGRPPRSGDKHLHWAASS
ncbi:hypothetical protein CDEF62S_04826 [Castellaniella defragrans]